MAISAVIVTHNSGRTLERVVKRLQDFDEILVCDNESSDNTVALAQSLGCRVVTFPRGNFRHVEPARNFAIQQARSEWVLLVDDDELVTPQLHDYLYKFINNPGDVRGIIIPRKNYILTTWRRSTYPDYQMRFFRKIDLKRQTKEYERPDVNGNIKRIPAGKKDLALIHMSPTISDVIARANFYTTGELDFNHRPGVNIFRLLWEPSWKFFRAYVLRGAMFLGPEGFMSAANDAMYRYLRLAKQYEHEIRDSWPEELQELRIQPSDTQPASDNTNTEESLENA